MMEDMKWDGKLDFYNDEEVMNVLTMRFYLC